MKGRKRAEYFLLQKDVFCPLSDFFKTYFLEILLIFQVRSCFFDIPLNLCKAKILFTFSTTFGLTSI